MDREANHELPRFMDLSAQLHDHRSTDIMHLRYFLDTRMKQKASRDYLLGNTPYRYSFRKDQLVKKAKTAQKEEAKGPEKKETRLPRLTTNSRESLVSVAVCKCWKDYLEEDAGNLQLPGVERKTSNTATSDAIEATLHSSHNSRGSLNCIKKSTCNLPHIQSPEGCSGSDRTKIEGTAPWLDTLLKKCEGGQESNSEFSGVMADGSRVTATHRKLYLEVFLPRM